MSDENKTDVRSNLRVLDFSKKNKEEAADQRASEVNQVVADMFQTLSERALAGDIRDFVITFKSESRGIESMIGAGSTGVRSFDFIGYVGMLELLKQRLLGIMGQMTYAYEYEKPSKPEKKDEPTDEQT